VTITYSKRSFNLEGPTGPKERPNPKPITICCEGQIVVSTKGDTSIYTGGFANCLGVAIATPDNAGGLVAHVKQMGKKPDIDASDEDYMTTFCRAIVARAVEVLNTQKLYVALYKGDTGGVTWSLGLKDDDRVLDVLDLRARSYEGGGGADLLFDTRKKKLYIPAGLSREQGETAADWTDTYNIPMGEVAIDLARRPMKVFHVA
jgi:hypothetical protein